MPRVRTTKKPMTSANSPATSTAAGSVHHRLTGFVVGRQQASA
jgi:hypothetical protein